MNIEFIAKIQLNTSVIDTVSVQDLTAVSRHLKCGMDLPCHAFSLRLSICRSYESEFPLKPQLFSFPLLAYFTSKFHYYFPSMSDSGEA